jgi:hypothetical protein
LYNQEDYLVQKIVMTINAFGMAYYCLSEEISKECAENVIKKLQDMGATTELFNDGIHDIIYAFVSGRPQ